MPHPIFRAVTVAPSDAHAFSVRQSFRAALILRQICSTASIGMNRPGVVMISSGLCRFAMSSVLRGSKAILQGGPLQWGRISTVAACPQSLSVVHLSPDITRLQFDSVATVLSAFNSISVMQAKRHQAKRDRRNLAGEAPTACVNARVKLD